MIVESFDLAPALILADVLTITDVMGRPPIKPAKIFPIPWALNSVFELANRLNGSIFPPASRQSSVSILATVAIVAAAIQTAGFVNPEKLGKLNWLKNSPKEEAVGNFTKCSPVITHA